MYIRPGHFDVPISDFHNPTPLYDLQSGGVDGILRGLLEQSASKIDRWILCCYLQGLDWHICFTLKQGSLGSFSYCGAILWNSLASNHSRPQTPRYCRSAPRIATSGRPNTGSPRFTDFPSLCAWSEKILQTWLAENTTRNLCPCSKNWTFPEQFLVLTKSSVASRGQECLVT